MGAYDAAIAAGMAQAASVLGEPVTIGGKVYQGVVNRFLMSREMREVGFRVDYELTIVIPVAQMPVAPAPYTTGSYKGKPVRVVKDGVDSDAISHTIRLAYAP